MSSSSPVREGRHGGNQCQREVVQDGLHSTLVAVDPVPPHLGVEHDLDPVQVEPRLD